MKKIIRVLAFFILFLMMGVFVDDVVMASYEDICSEKIETEDGYVYNCEKNIIYIDPSDSKSSYMIASNRYMSKNRILYAGVVDGLDTFYSTSFSYYRVVYDDRGLFTSSKSKYSDISINGEMVYNGKFKDNLLVDNSVEGFLPYFDEKGTYLIRHYVNSKVVRSIRMIVIDEKDNDLKVSAAFYGNESLDSKEMVYSNSNLRFVISGGKYGIGDNVTININECVIDKSYNKELILYTEEFGKCLINNGVNKISVTLVNGLNDTIDFSYKLNFINQDVTIRLVDSISKIETSSRRILIVPTAGKGKTLDEDSNLYYWSTSSSDKLTYEDFMYNYDNSKYKGTYSSNKGVILRNEDGTFYLYALASDGESYSVVRSDEYVLTKTTFINRVTKSDIILVVFLFIFASLPIFVYLIIRGKDTE